MTTISRGQGSKSRLTVSGLRLVKLDQNMHVEWEIRNRWELARAEKGKTWGGEIGGRTTESHRTS